MLFVWGRRTKVAQAGSAGVRYCGHCRSQAYFARMVQYTSCHLWWIVRWAMRRQPYLVCGNCGGAHHAEQADLAAPELATAIPFWDRRGWLVIVGSFAAFIVLAPLLAV